MYQVYYYKNNRYRVGKTIVKTFETEKEASHFCDRINADDGYITENGNQYIIDYEEVEKMEKPTLKEFLKDTRNDYIIEIYYGGIQGFNGTYQELKKHENILNEKVLSYDIDDNIIVVNL